MLFYLFKCEEQNSSPGIYIMDPTCPFGTLCGGDQFSLFSPLVAAPKLFQSIPSLQGDMRDGQEKASELKQNFKHGPLDSKFLLT